MLWYKQGNLKMQTINQLDLVFSEYPHSGIKTIKHYMSYSIPSNKKKTVFQMGELYMPMDTDIDTHTFFY